METDLILLYTIHYAIIFPKQTAQKKIHPLAENQKYDIDIFGKKCRRTGLSIFLIETYILKRQDCYLAICSFHSKTLT